MMASCKCGRSPSSSPFLILDVPSFDDTSTFHIFLVNSSLFKSKVDVLTSRSGSVYAGFSKAIEYLVSALCSNSLFSVFFLNSSCLLFWLHICILFTVPFDSFLLFSLLICAYRSLSLFIFFSFPWHPLSSDPNGLFHHCFFICLDQ